MGKGVLIVLIVLAALALAAGITTYFLFFRTRSKKLPGNADRYAAAAAPKKENSPLQGKTVIFLGSSVVYGSASMGDSFVEYLAKTYGVIPVKEAVSGTTLTDEVTYGRQSYIARMKTIDASLRPDAFVCQLSTNDATVKRPLGEISDSRNIDDFDTHTVTGAIEYIIAYARKTWHCPVIFFTGTVYTSIGCKEYAAMVSRLNELAEKWDIGVLDLWNDAEMRAVPKKEYALYMANGIHPTRAGYRDWWTPKFEAYLTEYLNLHA